MKESIVQEVRKAGEELAKKSNYSLQGLFKSLRNNKKTEQRKVKACVK
jgi:hypothetical protein